MVNYSNGKIYKIVCNKTGLIYIGSTTKKHLSQRLVQHRCEYNRYIDGKTHFMTSFKVLENNDYNILLLEICPCQIKEELYVRERYYIESLECVNKFIPGRKTDEYNKTYYIENKEDLLKKCAIYRNNNKEKIKECFKESFVCECGISYTYNHKLRHMKTIKHQNYLKQKYI